jgi:hypothetical protein
VCAVLHADRAYYFRASAIEDKQLDELGDDFSLPPLPPGLYEDIGDHGPEETAAAAAAEQQ